jgi:hypothetical protein
MAANLHENFLITNFPTGKSGFQDAGGKVCEMPFFGREKRPAPIFQFVCCFSPPNETGGNENTGQESGTVSGMTVDETGAPDWGIPGPGL